MGKLENESKKRQRKYQIQRAILTTLVVGGVLLIAGGGIAQAMVKSLLKGDWKKKRPDSMNRSLKKLLDAGYARFRNTHQGQRLEITERGKAYMVTLDEAPLVMPKPKKWDKKWRLVIFDIKEERRHDRDRLRNFLLKLGFLRLQNSVWVYPYDCEDLITLIKAEFRIGRGILYLIVDTIEYDKPILEHFGLHT
ncbi:MAG: CRISPR-associated endonuclease Cas2 [Parcubacteria group bacterium RIFCSPHIGHO2_01_FULL_45_26]|nr:MAG: CRISPR-associated endonuclease Cas2 [Parcubacteria group bacterium RIFCSPHIGHO2_01_FULL_45_26]